MSYRCPGYAIEDMEHAGREMQRYIEENMGVMICDYIDETDQLTRSTYAMALRYSVFTEVNDPEVQVFEKHYEAPYVYGALLIYYIVLFASAAMRR
jgi:hypothetical protein